MKAITVKQPWASLIVAGIKDIENRTWATKYRGPLLIHASAKPVPFNGLSNGVDFDTEQIIAIHNHWPVSEYGRYADWMCKWPNSAIIGRVDVVDCVLNHPSVWAEFTEGVAWNPGAYPNGVNPCMGHEVSSPIYNWVLANPVQFDEPILNVKGKLSLWEWEATQ